MLGRRDVQFAILLTRVEFNLFHFRRKQVLDADKTKKPEGKHERYALSSYLCLKNLLHEITQDIPLVCVADGIRERESGGGAAKKHSRSKSRQLRRLIITDLSNL